MARKKEPELIDINRKRIVEVSKKLFLEHGTENTKISDIAKEAEMCKSTLYVYFKSKEEIKNSISLEAMKYFYQELVDKTSDESFSLYDKYMAICNTLVQFKKKYPLSFQLIIEEMCVEDTRLIEDAVLGEIYEVGEKINQTISGCLKPGFHVTNDEELVRIIFSQWGSIYGLIVLADNKEAYMQKSMKISKKEFLQKGFEELYRLLQG